MEEEESRRAGPGGELEEEAEERACRPEDMKTDPFLHDVVGYRLDDLKT